jgi:hypothetical protein
MSIEYRATRPVTKTYFDGAPDDGLGMSFPQELWRGDKVPNLEDLRQILIETSETHKSGEFPIEHFSGSEYTPASYRVAYGNELMIEERARRGLLRRFGWEVIVAVPIEDLKEE